jgi:hypothetical protein
MTKQNNYGLHKIDAYKPVYLAEDDLITEREPNIIP